jgi:glucosamine-6-phosphate deaminase
MTARTLFAKIWDAHVIADLGDNAYLLHIDRHLLHDLGGSRGLLDLKDRGIKVHSPHLTFATPDHAISSARGRASTSKIGVELLQALRADPSIAWERVTAFHLDEFIGMGAEHPASFRRFLVDRLFAHVPVGAFHGLRGEAANPAAECARYAALLAAQPPSLAVLGIGENAHLAFIDPPMCDFREPLDVRVVELDEPCRRQMVHDGAFARLEHVPGRALSLTIPFLMRVPRVVPVVPGPAKTKAVTAALEGPLTCACPASILRRHSDALLFLDRASAAGLPCA